MKPLSDKQLQAVANFGGVAEQIEAIVTCTDICRATDRRFYSVQIISGDKLRNELAFCGPNELAEILDNHTERDAGDINAVRIYHMDIGEAAKVVGGYATDAVGAPQGDDMIDFFNLEWAWVWVTN